MGLMAAKVSRRRSNVLAAPLARPFWVSVVILVVLLILTAHPQNIESLIGASMITAAGCLPCAIWILRQMGGLPVFPVFAMTHVSAFGIPLLYEHPVVSQFEPDRQLIAAISVAGFLVIGTLVWYGMRLRSPKPPHRIVALESRTGETVFLSVLAVSILRSEEHTSELQ